MSHQTIVIVDFGSPNCQLVARRVRENNVYCEVVPYSKALATISAKKPAGVIFTGGTSSVLTQGATGIEAEVYSLGVPVLGIGYGAHLMVRDLGGKVEHAPRSAGVYDIAANGGLAAKAAAGAVSAYVAHSDVMAVLPEGFTATAQCSCGKIAAAEDAARGLYAVQFCPESAETPYGNAVLKAFLFDVCGCKADWTTANFVEDAIENVRKTVGDGRVLCALSGGVDSTVCAVLVHKAIGDRLHCVFVDHGLMRKNEGDEVMDTLQRTFKLNVTRVNAGARFLGKLAGVTDPERKRKIIGAEFIDVFTDEANKLGEMDFLLQGTIYPDIIESGVGAALVKSHHNVGGLPEKLGFKLLEPVRLLFKDEVRRLGTELGIPDAIVQRQPFPGPGLGVRCLGEITEDKLFILREADAIVREEIIKAGLGREIWQYFAVLPNLQSVGVKGDERTYAHAVGIRAVNSVDAMTSDWARIPHEVLESMSRRIVTEVPGVNRILYDCTTKPPSTIEWE